MREILFKAKIKDSNEWVIGDYVYVDYLDKHNILVSEKTNDGFSGMLAMKQYEVDGDTICQCTGLKDKNGKMIWENDICRRVLLPTKRIEKNFRIAYVPYKCCLSAIDLDGSNITFLSDYINNQYEVEVIGNIFDNPELLEK